MFVDENNINTVEFVSFLECKNRLASAELYQISDN